MKKRLDKSTKDFLMFQEYWKIIQDFYIAEETYEYWEKLNERLNDFSKKYGKFAFDLSIAFLNKQDREISGGK